MIKSFLQKCKEIRESHNFSYPKYQLVCEEIDKLQAWSDQINEDVDAIAINDHYDAIDKLIADIQKNHFTVKDPICLHCGKYKTMQGNGIIHQLCECG